MISRAACSTIWGVAALANSLRMSVLWCVAADVGHAKAPQCTQDLTLQLVCSCVTQCCARFELDNAALAAPVEKGAHA